MSTSREAELAEKRRYWKQHLKDWAASGKSQKDYCRTQDLSYYKFQYWKKRFQPKRSPAFIELQLPKGGKNSHHPIRLMIGGRYQIAIERDFDPTALQQLIGVLSHL